MTNPIKQNLESSAASPKPSEKKIKPKPGLLTLLMNTRVCFYPACYFDWRPLFRFGLPGRFDCQTFVYCDWLRGVAGALRQEIANIGGNPPPGHQLELVSLQDIQPTDLTHADTVPPNPMEHLRPDEIARYRDCLDRCATREGWGCLAKLRHTMNEGERDLNLVYLGAEGVATYLQVFRAQQIAPYMLCTVNCGVETDCGWTDFRLSREALGRAVELAPHQPEFVVNEGRTPYDWPWNELVQDFGDMKVFRRPDK
jgi:hypothetical protein